MHRGQYSDLKSFSLIFLLSLRHMLGYLRHFSSIYITIFGLKNLRFFTKISVTKVQRITYFANNRMLKIFLIKQIKKNEFSCKSVLKLFSFERKNVVQRTKDHSEVHKYSRDPSANKN